MVQKKNIKDTYLCRRKNTESWTIIKKLHQNEKGDITSPTSIEEWENYFKELPTENREESRNNKHTNNPINIVASPLKINVSEMKKVCEEL